MAQFSGTFSRPSAVGPAVAASIVAVVIAFGVLGRGVGLRTGTSNAPADGAQTSPVRSDRAAILAPPGGAPTSPARTDRAAILGGIQSEYVADVAGDWYATTPRTDRAAILGGIQSEYIADVATGWYATEPAVDPGRLQSEYLLELARDW